jgi:phosphatidylserine/phosphatidylglycerophosphate/cardiolipin synthase-like enzyme
MRSLFFFIFCLSAGWLSAQNTIAEIQGEAAASPLVGEVVTTSGIVTAVDGLGYFIQDGTGMWSGIYVYDSDFTPSLGDEIELTAEVEEYFDLTELKNVESLQVLSSGNALPEPEVLPTGEIADEGWESVLVRAEEAVCSNGDLGFGEFELNDGSGPIAVDDLFYLYTATQGTAYTVTGPCYYSFGAFKIVPRDANDVQIAEPLFYTELPEEFNMTTTNLEIHWQTNAPSNSIVEYGLTDSYELGVVADETQVTDHVVTLDGLEAATSYHIRVFSEAGEDITPLFERVVSTTSTSSGDIQIWFNHSVDNSVATTTEAVSTEFITDTIVHYIGTAQHTLDIQIYDLLDVNPTLITAVNAAHANGVQVRFISDLETENLALDNLSDDIPLLKGNNDGIMHNKFLIADAEYPELAWVMTGSMNWTWNNLGWDFNNVVLIRDQALARTYTREFNEMWGSETTTPDEANAKFGPDKIDNTAHKFIIGGIDIESYFSPSDGTTAQIRERIEDAQEDILLGLMLITENSLGTALADAQNSGVDVTGIIDYVEFNGSEFEFLLDNGANVVDYQNEDGTSWPDGPVLHHKYCIIDHAGATPVLVNGSHNWTASAESINDENTLIIQDADIANQFFQEWLERWNEQTGVNVSENSREVIAAYPNPFRTSFTLNLPEQGTMQIFDASGRMLAEQNMNAGTQVIDLSQAPQGVYTVIVIADQTYRARVMKR